MIRFRSVEVSEQAGDARIVLNVGGQKHETYLTTLRNIADTRLAWISERAAADPRHRKEYFFDRNLSKYPYVLCMKGTSVPKQFVLGTFCIYRICKIQCLKNIHFRFCFHMC